MYFYNHFVIWLFPNSCRKKYAHLANRLVRSVLSSIYLYWTVLQKFVFGIFQGQWILPSFDLSIGMGEDIIGSLNYYGFGDPLNLLAIFVTKNNIALLFSFMIILRMWLSGISLMYYFKYLKFSTFSSVLAALCYTFCGFAIYGGTMHVEWLSVLIYTPLILLGIFLSAPFFLPSVAAYMNSERQSTSITQIIFDKNNYTPKINFDLFNYLTHPFLEESPYLSGIIVLELLSIILLFFLPNTKKKIQCILFLIIALVAASLPITGYLFNAFGQTNDRWFYILHLLFAGIFVFVLDSVLLSLSKPSSKFSLNKQQLSLIHVLLIVSVTVNISINVHSLYSEKNRNWQSEFVKYSDVKVYIESPYTLFNDPTKAKELYRVSTDNLTGRNGRPENIAMLNNYYGLTYWFSIINLNTQSLVDQFNHNSLKWRSFGFGANTVFNTLYGVKYYLTKNTLNEPNNYLLLDTVTFNNAQWNVYENLNFANFSYFVDSEVLISIFNSTQSFDEKMTTLYSQIDKQTVDPKYKSNQINITTTNEQKKSLILGIPYNKNWRAYVDRKKQPINKIDTHFMTIDLDKGSHQVKFIYENKLIKLGIICSFLSLISLAFLNKTTNKQNKKKSKYIY